MSFAPVCLFTYRRLSCTKHTIDALKQNIGAQNTKLYIFSDGPKTKDQQVAVQEVRDYLDTVTGFKEITIYKQEENQGLANSIIRGVSQVIALEGQVIVLEDDLVTAPNFLAFMNEALQFYKDEPKIFSISGYTFPIKFPEDYPYDMYYSYRGSSWGWASWQDRWEKVDWEVKAYDTFKHNPELRRQFNRGGSDLSSMLDRQMAGKLDSWAIRWNFSQFMHSQYTVFPRDSKVSNIGFNTAASHTKFYDRFSTVLDNSRKTKFNFLEELIFYPSIVRAFRAKYSLKARATGRLLHYLGIHKEPVIHHSLAIDLARDFLAIPANFFHHVFKDWLKLFSKNLF